MDCKIKLNFYRQNNFIASLHRLSIKDRFISASHLATSILHFFAGVPK